jgi:hypothetical protein
VLDDKECCDTYDQYNCQNDDKCKMFLEPVITCRLNCCTRCAEARLSCKLRLLEIGLLWSCIWLLETAVRLLECAALWLLRSCLLRSLCRLICTNIACALLSLHLCDVSSAPHAELFFRSYRMSAFETKLDSVHCYFLPKK